MSARHARAGSRGHALGIPRPLVAVFAAVLSAALVVAGLSLGVAPASAAGTSLLTDAFTTNSVSSGDYVVGGTDTNTPPGSNTACLTVAGASASSVPASCAGTSDASGSGALRLTPDVGVETGFLLYNHALPTKAGLAIDFDMYQYGGTGADGIGFFLSDGAYDLSTVGASGGSLGYQNSLGGSGSGEQGLPHALLGIGFDAYGNFVHETNNPSCNTPTSWTDTLSPNTVAVRGPGVESAGAWDDGYCLLAAAAAPSDGAGLHSTATAGNRNAAVRRVHIVIDPPTDANPKVTVSMGAMGVTGNAPLTQVTSVNEPAALATTPTFKFGWSASTGGSTDIHEVSALQVSTVDSIDPTLSASATDPAVIDAGASSTVTFHSSVLSSGGPVASGVPVTETVTKPAGLDWGTLPAETSTGWFLQSSDATSAVYEYTPSDAVVPGTDLPDLVLPVSGPAAGEYDVTAVVSGGGIVESDNPAADRTATSEVTVRPTVAAVSHTTAPASASPEAETFTVPAAGGADAPSYSLTTAPAHGSASIDPVTGTITFTPAAGYSGTNTFNYEATEDSATSTPATVTVSTPPSATAKSDTVNYGATATVDLSAGAQGTGLGYAIVSGPPLSSGTASVSGHTLTFTPASGFSGTTTVTYQLTDQDALTSATATVTITVRPEANTATPELSLNSTGDGSAAGNLPAPSGSSGPYTYAVVTPPGSGTLTLNADGSYSYVAAPGASGIFTATYTVTDGDGVVSPPADLVFTVKPYTGPVTASTPTGTAVTLAAPVTAGAAGGTFAVTQPVSGGTATIDPITGKVSFTPATGTSGIVTFSYTVTANGVTSDAASVTIDVNPTVTNHAVTISSGQSTTVDLTAGAVGTSLAYSVLSTSGITGTESLDSATGQLSFTPDAGVSGTATFSYLATGADGLPSKARTVTITVLPVAPTTTPVVTLPQDGTSDQDFDLPVPVGTGPFTYQLVPGSVTPGTGTFSIDPTTGQVTYTPEPGVSGPVDAQYTVTDGAGNTSLPEDIDLTVLPFLEAVTTSADSGDSSYTLPAPVTAGTGPFTYAIVTEPDPALGTATIDPVTGVISYTPTDPTASGPVTITYTVTDASGTTSTVQTATLNVRPKVADVTGSGPGARVAPKAIVLTPTPQGTGPFTYRVVGTPAHVTVVATSTGFAVTPDAGYSGTTSFQFVAVDAFGIASTTQTATVHVLAGPNGLAFTGTPGVGISLTLALLALLAGAALLAVRLIRRRHA